MAAIRAAPRCAALGLCALLPLPGRRPARCEEQEGKQLSRRSAVDKVASRVQPGPPDFESLYDAGRFHLAAREQRLLDERCLSRHSNPGVQSSELSIKLEMAAFMESVFELIRNDLEDPVQQSEAQDDAREAQSESWRNRGFDDCSGENEDGVTCWLRIDFKSHRTTFCYDMPEVPVGAIDVLSLISEVQEAKTWFPFCRTSSELHVFPGPLPFVRIFAVEVGVQIFSIETVFVMAVEDQLQENGCISIYMFSPPEHVMCSNEALYWMGVEVPAMPQGLLNFRLPWEYQRVCIFPISETKCRIRCDVKAVDLFPPIPPVTRFFLRECSKRIVGVISTMAASGDESSVGARVRENSEVYAFWRQQLDAYFSSV